MLRVFNDDIVEAHTGFDTHPHEEMEIISIILDGEMTHQDTMGNETIIRKNDQARISNETKLSIIAVDSSELILIDISAYN